MFQGFSPETFAFFAALSLNNNKAFFQENKEQYEQYIRGPMLALAEALAPAVAEVDPQLDVRPAKALARIYRDIRFSNNKLPYRDYLWLGYRRLGESRDASCGFYFDISATGANWGCGYYHKQPEALQHLRQMMLTHPGQVLKVVAAPAFTAVYAVKGEAYSRQYQPPENMDARLGEIYRKKAVYAEHSVLDLAELCRPDLAERLSADFKTLAPFYALLRACMVKKAEEVVK